MDSYGGNWRQQPAGFNPEPQFQPQDAPSGNPNPNPNPVNTSIDEGRRIYMGNLQYTLTPEDVEQFLRDAEFGFTKIHMSVDDLYGRNPGYCFAEFSTKEEADRALAELPGAHLSGRAIKVGPCVPKRSDGQARFRQGGRTFDRPWQQEGGWSHWGGRGGESSDRPPPQSMHRSWGDYSRDRPDGAGPGGGFDRPYQQGQTRQRDWESAERKKKTLYVGGLPRQENTASFEAEIQDMFKDFPVESISKPKNPNRGFNERPGNNYFCFIEFATEDDAAAAMQALNGAPFQGANMRISFSRS